MNAPGNAMRNAAPRQRSRLALPALAALLLAWPGACAGAAPDPAALRDATSGAQAGPRSEYLLASRETAKALVRSAAAPTILINAAAAAVTYALAIAMAFSVLYFGTWTRRLLEQLLELMACVSPMVFLLVAYAARQDVGHWFFLLLALAIFPLVGRPLLARVAEAAPEFHFTDARMLGHSLPGVFRHYAWPRFAPLTLPYFFVGFIHCLLMESMFSSLGLVQPAAGHTWGSLIHRGLEDLLDEPWLVFYAGFAIMASALAAYLCVPLLDRLLSGTANGKPGK